MYKELLCTLITWKDIYRLCQQLVRQLRVAHFRVDVIVAIA
jgi:hypoxanthine phosphoribosyltransferase